MEVRGQLHSPATLPPGKKNSVSTEQEAGWAPLSVWTFRRRENILSILEIEPRTLQSISLYTDCAIPAAVSGMEMWNNLKVEVEVERAEET